MEEVLVATSKGVCPIICQRMRYMSTEQNNNKTSEATSISDHSGSQPWTLHNNKYRLDHQITNLRRMGLHSYHNRSRLLKSSNLCPLQRDHGNRRTSEAILQMGVPSLWNT